MRISHLELGLRALAASIVIGGCSVTVVPLRPLPADLRTPPRTHASAAAVQLPLDLDKPMPTCPDPAPPPAVEPSRASFVVQNGHDGTISRVALSRDGRRLATSAYDGTVRVWDTKTGLLVRRIISGGTDVSLMSLSDDGRSLAYVAMNTYGGPLHADVIDLETNNDRVPIGDTFGQIALTPDGARLVMATTRITSFDTKDARKIFESPALVNTGPGHFVYLALALDAPGKRVAAASPNEVVVLHAETGALVVRHPVKVEMRTTPIGVGFVGDAVVVRDASETLRVYSSRESAAPFEISGAYHATAMAPDRIWATVQGTKELVALSASNGARIALPNRKPLYADLVAASSDGTTLALVRTLHGNDPTIEIVDAASMRVIRTLEGRNTAVSAIAISPDGKALSTISRLGETQARWDIEHGSLLGSVTAAQAGDVRSLEYDATGEYIVEAASTWFVRVRNAKTNKAVRQFMPQRFSMPKLVAFLPQGKELITVTDHQIEEPKPAPPKPAPVASTPTKTTKTTTKKPAPKVPLPKPKATPPRPPPPPPRYETLVDRWDISGPIPEANAHSDELGRPPGKPVGRLSFRPTGGALSSDGTKLVVLGDAGEVGMMSVANGASVWTRTFAITKRYDDKGSYMGSARYVAFSPDNKLLLFSSARLDLVFGVYRYVPVLQVLDANTGATRGTYEPGTSGPMAMRGDSVVVGGRFPVVLEASTFALRARVQSIDGWIQAVATHPKRDLFFLGSNAGGTSVVDRQGRTLATLISTPNGEHIAVTPEGAYHSSIDGARSVAWSFSGPLEGFSFEQFSAKFNRPDIVETRLAGDNVNVPAMLSRPPQIDLEGANLRRGRVETSARAMPLTANVSSGSRVDHVRVFVDGRPVADTLVCAKQGRVSFDVPLHAGQNRVSLVGYDAAGYASNPAQLDVVSTSPQLDKPDLYVVTVGISSYPNMDPAQQLDYADDDARSVAESFSHFAGENRPFAKLVPITLLDSEATVEGIDHALSDLARMRPDDLAVVFFAGHGARLGPDKMVFLTRNAAFTRASAEVNGIGWDHIEQTLRLARGRVLLLLDACHSGYLSTEVVAPNEALAQKLAVNNRAGVLVFSAARGSQFSYEVPASGSGSMGRGLELAWEDKPSAKPPETRSLPGGHGLFTSALLEALSGEAPDRDRSGAIEVGELIDYVTERVRGASNGKQTPWVARREMFGEFMVAPPAAK